MPDECVGADAQGQDPSSAGRRGKDGADRQQDDIKIHGRCGDRCEGGENVGRQDEGSRAGLEAPARHDQVSGTAEQVAAIHERGESAPIE